MISVVTGPAVVLSLVTGIGLVAVVWAGVVDRVVVGLHGQDELVRAVEV